MERNDLIAAKPSTRGMSETVKRRGILAGVAALVVGVMAKTSGKMAEATDNTPVVTGQNNTSNAETRITRTAGAAGSNAFAVSNNNGIAISATATGVNNIGLLSTADASSGVVGTSIAAVGVLGLGSNFAGVQGQMSGVGYGVYGNATAGGLGVFGQGNTSIGVFGFSSGSTAVFGQAINGAAVAGLSNGGTALRGDTTTGTGLVVTSATAIGATVSGATIGAFVSSGNSGIAMFASNTNGTAGRFDGAVAVNGALTVLGDFTASGMKSAVVVAKDGATKRLYCLESPDSWFEDVGEGRLVNGVAQITIDPDYLSVVDLTPTSPVFLTPQADCNGLFVAERTENGFVVRELRGGTSSISFTYRIMARRADIDAIRLDRSKAVQRANSVPTPRIEAAPPKPNLVTPPPGVAPSEIQRPR